MFTLSSVTIACKLSPFFNRAHFNMQYSLSRQTTCRNTIDKSSPRYKCNDCPNFDLDSSCFHSYVAGSTSHSQGHSFEKIGDQEIIKGSVIAKEEANRTLHSAADEIVITDAVEPAIINATHPATCDICGLDIQGTRFKCTSICSPSASRLLIMRSPY
jgi:hypothetical protein